MRRQCEEERARSCDSGAFGSQDDLSARSYCRPSRDVPLRHSIAIRLLLLRSRCAPDTSPRTCITLSSAAPPILQRVSEPHGTAHSAPYPRLRRQLQRVVMLPRHHQNPCVPSTGLPLTHRGHPPHHPSPLPQDGGPPPSTAPERQATVPASRPQRSGFLPHPGDALSAMLSPTTYRDAQQKVMVPGPPSGLCPRCKSWPTAP